MRERRALTNGKTPAKGMDMSLAVEIKDLTKTFPGVRALSHVNLNINQGEVHAIVGENGAGKSTLMKILSGVYQADRGEILINGRKASIRSVKDAAASGISVIFQEFNLMPELTVSENIFISGLPKVKFLNILRLGSLNTRTKEVMKRLAIDINPAEYVKNLSVSKKQMVEIAKALSHNSDIIIMDEPTAALNNQEVDKLYEIIRMLKSENKTIIYISHRLKEIFDLADRVTVLRDGQHVGTESIGDLSHDRIVSMMVGREISSYYHRSDIAMGDPVLSVKGLGKNKVFADINLEVRKGEILGLAGLMGSGREEIAKSIYGLMGYDAGEIFIEGGKADIKSPIDALKYGIEFVTEDRKESGIYPQMSIKENLSINIIRSLSGFFGSFIDMKKESDILLKFRDFMKIRYSNDAQKIMYLSGGNQQKVVLSRALAGNCKILFLLEPTRGIDVGAKAEIYNLLNELAKSGKAIVMISSELPELISMCRRVLVVCQGRITGELSGKEIDENNIMQCATGNREIFGEAGAI
jgi:ABC-type sugar transport system ATPase subunit